MKSDRPLIESRPRRLLAYLDHNKGRMFVDATVLFIWILVASAIFDQLQQPTWLLYIVLFSGVVLYSRITPTWERPYRSPD